MTSSPAGLIVGRLLAPLTGALSAWRRARMFHPVGSLFEAVAEVPSEDQSRVTGDSDPEGKHMVALLRSRLLGPVLARFSGALWKTGSWPDVLGCALRFSRAPDRSSPLADDQDLLLASIRRPWTMPFAPFATRSRDYVANRYYGVSPFVVNHVITDRDDDVLPASLRIEWRLKASSEVAANDDAASGPEDAAAARALGLQQRTAIGTACFDLSFDAYPGCLHLPRERRFRRVIVLRLLRPSPVDQEALRFHPFQAGRGIVPAGFVQSARKAAYAASQAARPRSFR